jgi:hypothetical protein
MFLLNTELEVNWLIPATSQVYNYTDFDVIVINPNGDGQYIDAAIELEDFIAPTVSTTGGVTYKFTPNMTGVWKVILTLGNAPDSDMYNEYFLRISEADNHIYQQINLGI